MNKLGRSRIPNATHARIQEFSSRGRGPGQSDKKALMVFFWFFLVLSLFYRSQMVNFEENYHFSRFQRGVQHFPDFEENYHFSRFQRGSNIFQGGSNCLFLIETHITCDFPGGVRTPCPPLWSRTCYIPSPKVTSLLVLEKKIFKGVFTIYGRGGHLGHVTKIFCINFG